MRRLVSTVVLLMMVVSQELHAQRVAPVAVRRVAAPAPVTVRLQEEEPRFKPERILTGAALGALILAPLGALYAQGACEGANCKEWRNGLVDGAAVGAVLGGLFGLILALPPRAD